MLTKNAQYLISLCKAFLESKLPAKIFSSEFENFFVDDDNDFTEDESFFFDDILQEIAYFEPDEEVRKVEPDLIDEDELKKIVTQTLPELEKLR